MAVSSANLSGLPAALTCDEAIDQLGSQCRVYLDGGRLGGRRAAPSTIVDFTQADDGQVLRRGALSLEVLRETLPDLEDLVDSDEESWSDRSRRLDEPDDVVDGVVQSRPEVDEESAADVRSQIENPSRSR